MIRKHRFGDLSVAVDKLTLSLQSLDLKQLLSPSLYVRMSDGV